MGLQAVSTVSPPTTSGPILGGLAQLGRYFQVISVVPSAVVVVGSYLLVVGGAPANSPQWDKIANSVASLTLGSASVLVLCIIAFGMAVHPFQFVVTQALEGYWGPSPVGQTAMTSRSLIHLRRRRALAVRLSVAEDEIEAALDELGVAQRTDQARTRRAQERILVANLEYEALSRAIDRYPDPDRIRPTRLGNTLRRYEDLAGAPYGYGGHEMVPHLMWVAPAEHIANVDDARADLDLAVRFTISWLTFAVVGTALLWASGLWLAVPLLSYALAWLSYGGAVRSADEYGSALWVLFDLNHPSLLKYVRSPVTNAGHMSQLQKASQLSVLVRRTEE